MRGDLSGGNRSVLLTRWRGASAVVRPVTEPAVVTALEVPPAVPAGRAHDLAASLLEFELEISNSVAQPMADALFRLLAPSRDALLTEPSAANQTACLARLDLLEDVLDAALLASAAQ